MTSYKPLPTRVFRIASLQVESFYHEILIGSWLEAIRLYFRRALLNYLYKIKPHIFAASTFYGKMSQKL